jgi:hypothetical protein
MEVWSEEEEFGEGRVWGREFMVDLGEPRTQWFFLFFVG